MKLLGLVWHFGVHVIVGTFLFAVIGSAAVCLHFFVTWVDTLNPPFLIPYVLQPLEYFVFALDVLCYVWFLFRIVWRFMVEIRDATKW